MMPLQMVPHFVYIRVELSCRGKCQVLVEGVPGAKTVAHPK
jgi:hypothetical protein